MSKSVTELTPDIHIYDEDGNHSGYIYDKSGKPEYLELNVPGTYSINRPSGQIILIDSLANRNFALKTTPRSPGTYSLNANYIELNSDNSLSQSTVSLFENVTMESGVSLSQDLKTKQDSNGNFEVDSLNVRLSISRDTVALDWLDEPGSEVSIKIVNLSGKSKLSDISKESIRFAENLQPTKSEFKDDTFLITLSGDLFLQMLSSEVDKFQPIALNISTNIGESYITTIMPYVVESYPLVTTNEEDGLTLDDYSISQNYPNPFNPTTNIGYSLPESGEINISVYTMLGQKVATLIDGVMTSGQHIISFDASNLSSGTYLIMLKAEGYTETKKMTLIK
jgi:hypothetical protein